MPQEATVRHLEHDFAFKPIEWQWVVNSRLNVNVLAGNSGYSAIRKIQFGSEAVPSRLNRETGLTTGANFIASMGTRRPSRPQTIGRVDYFPLTRFFGVDRDPSRVSRAVGRVLYRFSELRLRQLSIGL